MQRSCSAYYLIALRIVVHRKTGELPLNLIPCSADANKTIAVCLLHAFCIVNLLHAFQLLLLLFSIYFVFAPLIGREEVPFNPPLAIAEFAEQHVSTDVCDTHYYYIFE